LCPPPGSAITNDDGSLVIRNLVSGDTYDVEARRDADRTALASEVATNTPLVLTLP
jgi:hypothetical protein